MTRQYYYRENACSANKPSEAGCICWHDEGTECLDAKGIGYLSPVFENDEGGKAFTWRDKPAATPAPAQPEGLTKTDIARIWRRVTGGTQFQPHEYDLFRAIADAGFAAGAAAPAEGAAREEAQEAVGKFAIEVEKMLCAKLGVSWTAAGISIVSLIDRLAAAPKEKP